MDVDEPFETQPRAPRAWIVTWGVLARPGFAVAHVEAHDADEALAVAAARRPDLPRPRVAFLGRA